jgi:hypothetical protein
MQKWCLRNRMSECLPRIIHASEARDREWNSDAAVTPNEIFSCCYSIRGGFLSLPVLALLANQIHVIDQSPEKVTSFRSERGATNCSRLQKECQILRKYDLIELTERQSDSAKKQDSKHSLRLILLIPGNPTFTACPLSGAIASEKLLAHPCFFRYS